MLCSLSEKIINWYGGKLLNLQILQNFIGLELSNLLFIDLCVLTHAHKEVFLTPSQDKNSPMIYMLPN